MKATSIFGGVQVINILVQIVRSKLVAVLLGPAGMGVMGLLTTSLSLLTSATNFGLGTSAVRNISEANATGDQQKIGETVSVLRKMVWLTGTLGCIVTLILSPFLSRISFGDSSYTLSFAVLSFTLLINQLAVGQSVLLQGMRRIKWMAKAGVMGSIGGLLIAVPLYYLLGQKGIVPALVISSVVIFCIQAYFSKKVDITPISISFKQAWIKSKDMMKLGFMLSLSGLISTACSYLVRIFISHNGNVADVGLYSAGFTMINVYVGLVFTAMSTDYYPRLSAISDSNQTNTLVNEQSEIALFILSPLICIFLVFINWIIIVLYSDKFLPISDMIHWATLGIFFKSLSWAAAFIILAKGNSKFYFWNELIANLYMLILNAIGYYYLGLTGLGISFLVGYVVYFFQIYLFTRIHYGFRYNKSILKYLFLFLSIGVLCFLITLKYTGVLMYTVGCLLLLVVLSTSIYALNKRLNFLSSILSKIKK